VPEAEIRVVSFLILIVIRDRGMSDTPAIPLKPWERRVLGVLIEKQKTSKSADAYPMTLNSIMVGCNQKSNREPVLELDSEEVETTLDQLQKKLLVMKMTGSRVDRWRHLAYEQWSVSKVDMAILAELLLRGGQTEGDLRARVCRMDEIPTLELLRQHLGKLIERGLVIPLNEPGRRGSAVTHAFGTEEERQQEKARLNSSSGGEPMPTSQPHSVESADLVARVQELESAVEQLRAEIAELRQR
jgi:hypothetical protein